MTRIYDQNNGVELHQIYTEATIAAAVDRLAEKISADYAGREILMLVVLKGAFVFAADLARKIKVPLRFDFVELSSYEGMSSTGSPVLTLDAQVPLHGRHVLVVEDIVDTGVSLSFLLEHLKGRQPASLKICALVDKRERRRTEIEVDYAGLICDRGFLVGYGLDFDGAWRELPAIYHAEQINGRRAG